MKVKSELRAKEAFIVKQLADNELDVRNRAINKLRDWLQVRSKSKIAEWQINETSLERIWKGLFHYMWTSDKPLIQEECAEKIAEMLKFSKNVTHSLLFFKVFLTTMLNEYFEIDHFRLDKFLLLTRLMLRKMLEILYATKWDKKFVKKFRIILNKTIFCSEQNEKAFGFVIFLVEIFLEELATVDEKVFDMEVIKKLLKPFAQAALETRSKTFRKHLKMHVLSAFN